MATVALAARADRGDGGTGAGGATVATGGNLGTGRRLRRPAGSRVRAVRAGADGQSAPMDPTAAREPYGSYESPLLVGRSPDTRSDRRSDAVLRHTGDRRRRMQPTRKLPGIESPAAMNARVTAAAAITPIPADVRRRATPAGHARFFRVDTHPAGGSKSRCTGSYFNRPYKRTPPLGGDSSNRRSLACRRIHWRRRVRQRRPDRPHPRARRHRRSRRQFPSCHRCHRCHPGAGSAVTTGRPLPPAPPLPSMIPP